MPKSILVFKLPQERTELEYAQQGMSLASLIWDLDQWLRNKSKYDSLDKIEIDAVRKKIRELRDELSITCIE